MQVSRPGRQPQEIACLNGDDWKCHDGKTAAIGKYRRMPQLLNVLRGEISLIGPRPHALAHDNYFETVLSARMLSGRNATERAGHAYDRALSERVKRDLWYINNWSLRLDIKY